jgi:hypothetical protein
MFCVSIPQWCDCCAAISPCPTSRRNSSFNPTMVRLLLVHLLPTSITSVKFQSHNGAIAALNVLVPNVRRKLKVSIPQWCDCCSSPPQIVQSTLKFQSHNGAIAAETVKSLPAFDANSVSIPQWCDCCLQLFHPRNDLSLSIPQWCDCCRANSFLKPVRPIEKFQSHNGAIAAVTSASMDLHVDLGFNPTMVRLLLNFLSHRLYQCPKSFNPTMVRLLPQLHKIFKRVSIPQWCDCCIP